MNIFKKYIFFKHVSVKCEIFCEPYSSGKIIKAPVHCYSALPNQEMRTITDYLSAACQHANRAVCRDTCPYSTATHRHMDVSPARSFSAQSDTTSDNPCLSQHLQQTLQHDDEDDEDDEMRPE